MTHRELLCEIKKLEKIEPKQTWVKSTRAFIVDYIRAEEAKRKEFSYPLRPRSEASFHKISKANLSMASRINSFVSGLKYNFSLPLRFAREAKRAVSFAAVLILVLAGNFVAAEASESLPGDEFYPVKILMEKTQLALTFDEEKRAALNFELTEKRLNEFALITENSKNINGNAHSAAVNTAMESFKNQLNAAVTGMDNIAKSDANKPKATAAAKIIGIKTADYAEKIKKTESALNEKSSAETKGQMTEVMNKIEEVNIKALAVLVSAGDEADSQEVASKVEEKIKNTEEKFDSIRQKALVSGESENASKLIEQAKGVLSEAKKDLAGNDSSRALEKVIISNEMTKTAEKMVAASAPSEPVAPSITPSPVPTSAPTSAPTLSPSVSPLPAITLTPTISPMPKPALSPSVSPAPTAVER